MRKLLAIILAVMTMTSVACAAPEYGEHATVATVDYDELYWGQGISYTRVIELQHSGEHNGTLVATYEMYTSGLRVEKPGYNIHVSHDGGSTWEMVATVREKAAAIQSEFQPFLYELPSQVGDMPAGTLLLAACSIDAGHGRQSAIRMYRSYDIGKSWEQFGTVSVGGGLETGVWEPFLMVLPDGRVVTGKTSSLLGASAALLLNALKAMAGIRSDMNLISNQVIEPISALKIQSLGHHNPRLHSDEVLIALAISALTNPLADMARAQLGTLRGCDAHFSVIISEEDIKLYKRLGIHVSCEPKYESKRLYHK